MDGNTRFIEERIEQLRGVEVRAKERIGELQREIEEQHAASKAAEADRAILEDAKAVFLRWPPDHNPDSSSNSTPNPGTGTISTDEPGQTKSRTDQIVEIALVVLSGGDEVAFSDIHRAVTAKLGGDVPKSTIQSALERSHLLERASKGVYRLRTPSDSAAPLV